VTLCSTCPFVTRGGSPEGMASPFRHPGESFRGIATARTTTPLWLCHALSCLPRPRRTAASP
jgi:hypothetical protein